MDLEQQHDQQLEQNSQWIQEKKTLITDIQQLKELVSDGKKKEGVSCGLTPHHAARARLGVATHVVAMQHAGQPRLA